MRLLLAEDEKELSKALTAILKHNGYSVDAVYNGKDALDYLNIRTDFGKLFSEIRYVNPHNILLCIGIESPNFLHKPVRRKIGRAHV